MVRQKSALAGESRSVCVRALSQSLVYLYDCTTD